MSKLRDVYYSIKDREEKFFIYLIQLDVTRVTVTGLFRVSG